jgi:hypothetical protein
MYLYRINTFLIDIMDFFLLKLADMRYIVVCRWGELEVR